MTHSDRNYGGSVPRYLAILVAAVLGLSLFPATAFAAHNPDNEDPCEGVPVANEYVDREEARDVHEASIDCVIYWAIAVGSSNENGDPVYNPTSQVRRDQMAAFIYNTLENAGYDVSDPETAPNAFTDDEGSPFEGAINALADEGIVNGTTATTYSPAENIERDQMASFMVQAANWAVGDDHPVESDDADRFTDVPETNVHEDNIEAGADAGLFSGVTATTFEPNVNVRRDQMATFLVRLFQYIFGDQAPAPTTVAAEIDGRTVTGTITGADSATVSGCGFDDQTVTDEDTATDDDEIEFTLEIPESQAAGDCELTFTVTRPNGQEVVRSVTVTVEGDATGAGVTSRPELVDAEVIEVDTTGADRGTTIRYCFDEEIERVVTETNFHAYSGAGTDFTATEADEDADDVNCVIAFFSAIGGNTGLDTQAGADALTVATVDFGAVQDVDNDDNPIGDAPLNGEGGETTLPGGETAAPDLTGVDVQNRITGTDTFEVVFTFDETVATATSTGFSLILEDGTVVQCVNPDTTPATATVEVECDFGDDEPGDVSRGVVQEGTVADGAGTPNENPLQAAEGEGDDGNTDLPDLVSAEFFFNEDDTDEVAFTFDEPVDIANCNLFGVYYTSGDEDAVNPLSCTKDSDRVVLVEFADGTLDEAVGAFVNEGAVDESGGLDRDNRDDEVGVENTTSTQGAGFTAGPDLIEVNVEERTSSTGTVIGIVATYTFDEDVEAAVGDLFYLYAADGTRYRADAGNCEATDAGEESTVECTEFDRISSPSDTTPDDDDVLEAVLGTVDNDQVVDDVGTGNPEGAEPVTGA